MLFEFCWVKILKLIRTLFASTFMKSANTCEIFEVTSDARKATTAPYLNGKSSLHRVKICA